MNGTVRFQLEIVATFDNEGLIEDVTAELSDTGEIVDVGVTDRFNFTTQVNLACARALAIMSRKLYDRQFEPAECETEAPFQ